MTVQVLNGLIIVLAAFGAIALVFIIVCGTDSYLQSRRKPPHDEALDLSGLCAQYGFEQAYTYIKKNAEGAYEVYARVIPAYWQMRVINELPKERSVIITLKNENIPLQDVLLGFCCTYASLDTARIAMSHNRAGIIEFGAFLQNWVPRPQPPAVIEVPYNPIDEALR
jgi:hypothetical protein